MEGIAGSLISLNVNKRADTGYYQPSKITKLGPKQGPTIESRFCVKDLTD